MSMIRMDGWAAAPLDTDDYGDPREAALDIARIELGMCANCCIADATDEAHEDCAGPEGYVCECPCKGRDVPPGDG